MKKHLLTVGIMFLLLSSLISISQGYNVNISDNIEQCSIPQSNGFIQNLIYEASESDTIFIQSGVYFTN